MHAELHDLAALALLVVGGQVVFLLAVGDGDDVGGLVDAALELALVAEGIWVRVNWVYVGVSSLAKRRIGAVRAIDGVEEGVEETAAAFETGGVEDVVCLVEYAVLWVDDGVWRMSVDGCG